jgi:hypothetical protein
MFLLVPTLWWTASPVNVPTKSSPTKDGAAAAAPPWRRGERKMRDASALLDRIAPEFLVTVTRSALLAMTTSLTKVSARVYGACQQLNQVLAFGRMARAMFPWAGPACNPFDLSEFGSWLIGDAFKRAPAGPAPFSFASLFWWTAFRQPALARFSNPWSLLLG